MKHPILTRVRPHAPAIAVLVACIFLTLMAFLVEQRHAHERASLHASADAAQFQRALTQGIDSYVALNRNVAAYFTASSAAPDAGASGTFDIYMRSAGGLRHNPGMSYIGYIRPVRRAAPGPGPDPDFTYPFLFVYPIDARARRVEGLDHATIPERWAAIEQARDSGKTVATAKHLPPVGLSGMPVIVVFTPIYDRALPASTPAERRLAIKGYVFSIFYIGEMVDRVMGSDFQALFDLEIYDGAVRAENILYDGDNRPHVLMGDADMPVARQGQVQVGSRAWQLYFYPKPIYFSRYQGWNGVAILIFGFAVSAALALMMWNWTRRVQARWQQQSDGLQFDSVFETYPAAVYAMDRNRRIVNANAHALSEFKVSKAALIGRSAEQFIVPEKRSMAQERFNETLRGNAVSYHSAIIDGEGVRSEMSVIMIPVKNGNEVVSVLGIAQNITAQKQSEWRLKESRKMLQLVIDNIPQRVFWKDTNFAYLGANKAAAGDAGVEATADIIGRTDFELAWRASASDYRRDDVATLHTGIARINYEERQERSDGSTSWLRTSKIPLTDMDGNTVGLLGMYEDITERKNMENQLRELAHYDVLTGLANRGFFLNHLNRAIAKRQRRNSPLALMYFDVDHFKAINDTHGHDVGDALLSAFSRRISDTVREMDVFARLGGDEFALMLEDVPNRSAAEQVAAKLVRRVQAPFELGAHTISVSTSIGVAFFEQGMLAEDLIRSADQAMYAAKREGRNRFKVALAPGQA